MLRINDAIVRGGQLLLSDLPFPEGQRVEVVLIESDTQPLPTSIHEVRRILRGGVERFDDPSAPVIPCDDWEMLK